MWEDKGQAIAARLDAWGMALFAPLFGPGAAGQNACQRAREHTAEGVVSGTDPAFLSLPCDLMKDPQRPTPLVLDLRGISRRHPAPGRRVPILRDPELRVLMVIARL